MTQEAPQQPQEAPVVKLDQKATVDATALQQEAIQGNQKETKAEQEAKFSPEELARSQREGAARMESILDRGGYKFTMDTEAEVAKIKFHPDLGISKRVQCSRGGEKASRGLLILLAWLTIILYETNDGQPVYRDRTTPGWISEGLSGTLYPGQILKESRRIHYLDMAVIDAENKHQSTIRERREDYAKYFERIQNWKKEAERRGLLRNDKGKLGFYTARLPPLRYALFITPARSQQQKQEVIAEIGARERRPPILAA
jgi:hypothetical protein